MELRDGTDHVAILALMAVGVLVKRLNELGHLDPATRHQIHQLVVGVRTHAHGKDLGDLDILFDNVDHALGIETAEI